MTAAIDIRTALSTHGLELPDFDTSAPPTLVRRCVGCGAEVARAAPLGMCSKCIVAEVQTRRDDVLARAVPEMHRGARFGSDGLTAWCKDPTAIRWALAVGEKAPACSTVTLWGTTGGGKSTLAAAILAALLSGPRRYSTVAWADAREIAQARREHKLGRGKPPMIEAAIDADLFVLDELGKETLLSGADPADVVSVLDERHRRRGGRMTIITTEWSALADGHGEKLADLYMPSLVRRLTEPWRPGPPPVGSAIVVRVRRADELEVA